MPHALHTHEDFRSATDADLLALFFRTLPADQFGRTALTELLSRTPRTKPERQLHAAVELIRRATETELENIYKEIDLLEKSKVKTLEYKMNPPEKYYGMLLLGIVLIALYKTVHHTLLKSIP